MNALGLHKVLLDKFKSLATINDGDWEELDLSTIYLADKVKCNVMDKEKTIDFFFIPRAIVSQ